MKKQTKILMDDDFYSRLKTYNYYLELRETLSDISSECGAYNAPEDGIYDAGDKILEAIKMFDVSLENLRRGLNLAVIINDMSKNVSRIKNQRVAI